MDLLTRTRNLASVLIIVTIAVTVTLINPRACTAEATSSAPTNASSSSPGEEVLELHPTNSTSAIEPQNSENEVYTNGTTEADALNATLLHHHERDPRVLSFIRDLFSSLTSSSGNGANQRLQVQHQQQQQYANANYPEVDKYGEYLQSYPVNAQYNVGNQAGVGRPGPLNEFYPGSVASVPVSASNPNPNYNYNYNLNPSASLAQSQAHLQALQALQGQGSQGQAGSQSQSPWVMNPNYNNNNPNYNPNYNYNYNNYAQSVLSQLGGAGPPGAGLGLGGLGLGGGGLLGSNLVNNPVSQDSSSSSGILKTLLSTLGLSSLTSDTGSGASASGTGETSSFANFLNSAGEFDPMALLTRLFDRGSNSMESLVNRMNKFDKLQCIPRLICQTIARRQEDAALAALTSTTTTSTTRRSRLLSNWDAESTETQLTDVDVDPENAREGKFIKFQGIDTALAQFVNFLDLMQLKEWSLYPLLNGAYHGSQAKRTDDCRTKFDTCPFSDQQLVYYFNNYNGGFFQSI